MGYFYNMSCKLYRNKYQYDIWFLWGDPRLFGERRGHMKKRMVLIPSRESKL